MLEIKVIHVYPPIPTNAFDWCAYCVGDEEEGPRGWGATREEAIEDLKGITDE